MSLTILGARPVEGSSITMTSGCSSRARPIATCCCWPPLSRSQRTSSFSPTAGNRSVMRSMLNMRRRARPAARRRAPCTFRGDHRALAERRGAFAARRRSHFRADDSDSLGAARAFDRRHSGRLHGRTIRGIPANRCASERIARAAADAAIPLERRGCDGDRRVHLDAAARATIVVRASAVSMRSHFLFHA